MLQSQWLLGNLRTHGTFVKGNGQDTICGIHAQMSKKLQTPLIDNEGSMYVEFERQR